MLCCSTIRKPMHELLHGKYNKTYAAGSTGIYPGGKVKKQTRPAVKGWTPETISTYI